MLGFVWLLRSEAARVLSMHWTVFPFHASPTVFGFVDDVVWYISGQRRCGWMYWTHEKRDAAHALLTRYTARTEIKS